MAKLYFKYGAMGSSKTATALITKYNYEERGMKVWLIKPAADSRDGQFTLKSRIGLSSECEAISADKDIRTLYHAREKADVIIVDECQFMTTAQIDQLRELVDREDLPVLCFGLPLFLVLLCTFIGYFAGANLGYDGQSGAIAGFCAGIPVAVVAIKTYDKVVKPDGSEKIEIIRVVE